MIDSARKQTVAGSRLIVPRATVDNIEIQLVERVKYLILDTQVFKIACPLV